MPRRVYSAKFLGSEVAESWQAWTEVAALGGIVLFVSSLCFLVVVIATALFGREIDVPAIGSTEPIDGPLAESTIWDRFGLWITIVWILILAAYAVPLYDLYTTPGFPSPGFQPF